MTEAAAPCRPGSSYLLAEHEPDAASLAMVVVSPLEVSFI